ncbi:uncharacterized protein LOC109594270 [Aethina tumida]|uniref:uncharacterized protein LOC109594270 n=1 Tax=Aethina tumida TaxID=116153 RepID=UPI0021496764|nr:uncharacterized protein LOC109594270 [Aethina tumida]
MFTSDLHLVCTLHKVTDAETNRIIKFYAEERKVPFMWLKFITASHKSVYAKKFVYGKDQINTEIHKHLSSQNWHIIHPMSICSQYFDYAVISNIILSLIVVPVDDFIALHCYAYTPSMWFFSMLLKCFKLTRQTNLYRLISKYHGEYYVKTVLLPITSCFIMSHWLICLMIYMPRVDSNDMKPLKGSWLEVNKVNELSYAEQYWLSLLRYVGCSFCAIDAFESEAGYGEYFTILIVYMFGVVMWALIAISLYHFFTEGFRSDTQYGEIMDQLEGYIHVKQFPAKTKEKLILCYKNKFRTNYYNSTLLKAALSENLQMEVNIYVFRSLIAGMPVFAQIGIKEASEFFLDLKTEIYLPNDVILSPLTREKYFYILAYGTVCVTHHSGKEICHLEGGSHFGEVELLLGTEVYMYTVTALEVCEIYMLESTKFQSFLNKFPKTRECLKDSVRAVYGIKLNENEDIN